MSAFSDYYIPKVLHHLGRRMTREEKMVVSLLYILGLHPKEVARQIMEASK